MVSTFLSAACHGEAFPRLGVQDVAEFNSDWCSIYCLMKEEEQKE
jgi:hypothetical protein